MGTREEEARLLEQLHDLHVKLDLAQGRCREEDTKNATLTPKPPSHPPPRSDIEAARYSRAKRQQQQSSPAPRKQIRCNATIPVLAPMRRGPKENGQVGCRRPADTKRSNTMGGYVGVEEEELTGQQRSQTEMATAAGSHLDNTEETWVVFTIYVLPCQSASGCELL